MWEILLSSFKDKPYTFQEKNVFVEERFGKNKDIIKKYHILDISEKENTIIYSLVGCDFVYSAPFKYLSKNFIEQIFKQINNSNTSSFDEEIAETA
jgi:hypothetical protein